MRATLNPYACRKILKRACDPSLTTDAAVSGLLALKCEPPKEDNDQPGHQYGETHEDSIQPGLL